MGVGNQLISVLKSVNFFAKKKVRKAVVFICVFLRLFTNKHLLASFKISCDT